MQTNFSDVVIVQTVPFSRCWISADYCWNNADLLLCRLINADQFTECCIKADYFSHSWNNADQPFLNVGIMQTRVLELGRPQMCMLELGRLQMCMLE